MFLQDMRVLVSYTIIPSLLFSEIKAKVVWWRFIEALFLEVPSIIHFTHQRKPIMCLTNQRDEGADSLAPRAAQIKHCVVYASNCPSAQRRLQKNLECLLMHRPAMDPQWRQRKRGPGKKRCTNAQADGTPPWRAGGSVSYSYSILLFIHYGL